MRVLFAIPSIGPLRGGPSIAVKDMCYSVANSGCNVTLINVSSG